MVLVLLTTKDDPKYGPYVNTSLFVDVGLWVGTSLPSDTGDLSGGSDPTRYGYSRGGIRTQRTFSGARRDYSTGQIEISAVSTHMQPRTSGYVRILTITPSRVLHSAKGGIEAPQATGAKSGSTPKGYHAISKATTGHKGHTTSQ